jgi:hypothetical protein
MQLLNNSERRRPSMVAFECVNVAAAPAHQQVARIGRQVIPYPARFFHRRHDARTPIDPVMKSSMKATARTLTEGLQTIVKEYALVG